MLSTNPFNKRSVAPSGKQDGKLKIKKGELWQGKNDLKEDTLTTGKIIHFDLGVMIIGDQANDI